MVVVFKLFLLVTESAITESAIQGGTGFVESVRAWVDSVAWLNAFSGMINTGLLLTGIIVYNKYIAPKLSQTKWFNGELTKVYEKLEEVDQHIMQNTGIELDLIKNLEGVKSVLDIAFMNSNLPQISKHLIHNILTTVASGETEGLKEQFNQLSDEGKKIAQDLIRETQIASEEIKKTALQQLAESLNEEE